MADILLTIGIDPTSLSSSIQQVQGSLNKVVSSSGKISAGLGVQEIKDTGTAIDKVDHKAKRNISTMLKWAVGWTIAYTAIRQVQQGLLGVITVTRDVETEMAMIRVVTDETARAYRNLQGSIFSTAKEFGGSILDIAGASKTWAQQGRSVAEVMELTRTTMIGSNITGDKAKTIVSNLTAALKIYNLSVYESISIMDKWIAVASRHAIESGQLAEGLKRVGTIAREVGVNLDELNGYLTAVHAITRRELPQIGTAFRTIFARMARESTLNLIQSLTGIATYLDETGKATTRVTGTYRDFSDVLDRISAQWNNLSQAVRFHLAQQIAGVRRMEIFTALMQNYNEALLARIHSEASAGRAMRANSIIVETYAKQVEKLKASFAELQVALGESGVLNFLRNIVFGLKEIIESFKKWSDKIVSVTFAVGSLASALTILWRVITRVKLGMGGWVSILFLVAQGLSFLGKRVKQASGEVIDFNEEIRSLQFLREYQKSLRNLAEEYLNLYDTLKFTPEGQKVLNELLKEYNKLAEGDAKVSTRDLGEAFEELKDKSGRLQQSFEKTSWDIYWKKMDKVDQKLASLKNEYNDALRSFEDTMMLKTGSTNDISDAEKALRQYKEIATDPKMLEARQYGVEMAEGEIEKIARLYKEITKATEERKKTEIELNKLIGEGADAIEEGHEIEADIVDMKKLAVQYELDIGRALGISEITLAKMNIELKERNDLYENNTDRLKDQLELQRLIVEETYKLAQTLKDDVKGTLFNIIEGTGTWKDIIENITDTLLKEKLSEFVDNIEDETGIFKTISKAVKGKGSIADATQEALISGAQIVKQAEIEGHTIGGDALIAKLNSFYSGVGDLLISKTKSSSMARSAGSPLLGMLGGAGSLGAIGQMLGSSSQASKARAAGSPLLGMFGGIGSLGNLPTGSNAAKAGGGMLKGLGSAAGAAAALYGAYSSGSPVSGALSGAMAGTMILPGIGTAIGAIAGGLAGMFGAKGKETSEVREQTEQITSKIEITNKKLDVVNRNLSAIRQVANPYPLQESAYFSLDQARGYMR